MLSPKDMGRDTLRHTRDRITDVAVEKKSPVTVVPAGSVAIVVRSGILERTIPVALVPFNTTLNQDMKAIQTHPGISPRWVAWALRAFFAPEIMRQCRKSGTTVASLSTDALMDFRIPLAPSPEQGRIIELIEDHVSRLDVAVDYVRRSKGQVAKLRQAALTRALKGEGIPLLLEEGTARDLLPSSPVVQSGYPWKLPEGWLWAKLGDLFFKVYVGTTPSRKEPSLWSGSVPWVSSGEVNFSRISETREKKISPSAVGNWETRVHPPGTVMIAMIGEGKKTRGQVGILDIEAAHNQKNCASIRVSETRVLPEYVFLALEQRYLESRRASSGGNQPALNKAKVEAIQIPLPPLATQRHIVAAIEEFSVMATHFHSVIEGSLSKASSLRRSIFLTHAFGGKIAPQDSADEPAVSLFLGRSGQQHGIRFNRPKRAGRSTGPGGREEVPPPPHSSQTSVFLATQQELPL